MKRTFLLALTLSFVFACSPKPATNGNGSGNINASANANLPAGAPPPPAIVTIVITLGTKPGTDTYTFYAAPDCPKNCPKVRIDSLDQVQWLLANPTDLKLTDVHINNFRGETTGKTDPFGGGKSFDFPLASAQTIQTKLSGTARFGFGDTYKYDVVGNLELAGGSVIPVKADPRVIITD